MKQILIKIVKLLAPYKWWMLLSIIIGFFTIGSSIGLLMTSAYIISKAALQPHIGELQVGIVGVRFFGISRGLFRYAERLISHDITFNLLAKFRVWFFKAFEPLVPSKTGKLTSGDLLSRVVADVETLEHIFIRVVSPPLIAVFVAILVFILFANFSIAIAFIFLIPYSFAAIVVPWFTYMLSKKISEQIIILRARLSQLSLDGIEGKNELISFGKVADYKAEFNETNNKLIKIQRRMKLITGMNESLIGLLMNISVVSVFVSTAPLVSNGLLDGIYLAVLTLGTMAAFEAVFPIPLALQYLNSSTKAGERLFQITEQVVVEKKSVDYQLIGKSISLYKVSFSYNGNEKVLDEISFKISNNKKIAIIGGSGAGKSTITNLLLNFWNINSGSLTIDNYEYNQLSEEKIREKFSIIPQKVFLFSDTIKNNLLIAKPDATDYEIWFSLEKAELNEFVQSLPNKLDTWIGNQGKQLSGGERRRLAIARAILKDSPIFICDEITADLDSVNEMNILNTVHLAAKDKSLIFITHRLVDMDKFDLIYLMEKGKIVAVGSHEELISNSDIYKKYFLQN
ncbi:MAG: thiol reductant ABC exporter subunit CydC [Bacteroidetes bacterium]|nr:thiol reductant ABC exporter subunit CydC [Bacteroidota bacterium]MBU1115702.1 thiol reductant ABC exporter subunit CydC [Bacteroidota bacterium]MBU1799941.1 thiol reductant ABC exporter subunit CydC [Bacteroidota bacterium]